MKRAEDRKPMELRSPGSGLAGWLLQQVRQRLKATAQAEPKLALIERITLAPRQSLALVEAEGRRFLVASSSESGPVFYALDGPREAGFRQANSRKWARIS